ncbi:MAG: DUF3147 family protein [Verrucomicrobiales bacterium]|nr:DUF3147 family protein [Verrucomicrobiales bacterium]
MLTIIKLIVSAGLIYLVNEIVVTRSRPVIGSLIASLPLVSLITFFWIYFDLKGTPEEQVAKLSAHSSGVFWFVIPSLPMFLIFPALLKRGLSFWSSLGICCVITMILYAATAALLKRFGVSL